MKYSVLIYTLFMGLCGIYAATRHIRSLPKDKELITNLTKSLTTGKNSFVPESHPSCPVPPLECPNDNITFWYYSSAIGERPIHVVHYDSNPATLDSGSGPWKVLISGFREKKEGFPVKDLIAAYNKKGLYNIIVVDYYPLATDGCYFEAIKNIPLIAKCTAAFLEYLIESKVIKEEDLHVIGYDMGSQIAGSLHEYMANGDFARISAFEPFSIGLPHFLENKLTKNSAKFVELYHSSDFFRGEFHDVGHAEYFFNSGVLQPACLKDVEELLECSHERSIRFFIESISYVGTDDGFYGIPCRDYWWFVAQFCRGHDDTIVKIGEGGNTDVRGTFHLQTRDEPPYALGKVYKFNAKL